VGGEEVGEDEADLLVEGVLRVIRHRPWLAQDGTRFGGFTELRITRARRCR
jgi:hypothetical protein